MSKISDAIRRIQEDAPVPNVKPGSSQLRVPRDAAVHMEGAQPDVADVHTKRELQMDHASLQSVGLVSPDSESRRFQDEYRVIKRPVLANAFGQQSEYLERGHSVLVTSPLAGDGKTFTAFNLALSIAREKDVSVLLVDADVSKRHISTLLDVAEEPGLLDYLEGSVGSLQDVEIRTSIESMNLLPAGVSRDNSTELLASRRMGELLDESRRRCPNRIVLIDSAPLLETTESQAIAGYVGQVAIVVRAGVTPKKSVIDAAATINQDMPINLILNHVSGSGKSSYYGGYYGAGAKETSNKSG